MQRLSTILLLLAGLWAACARAAEDVASGPSSSPAEANKERLVIDDMEDVSDWSTGSPDETTLSADVEHVRQGRYSLEFANLVDHTRGETNYPVGWPRARKDLRRNGLTDWSDYDFFECSIYAETSRDALPATPLAVGFYHSGQKRSTHVRLGEVTKDAWTRIVIPVSEIDDPTDVQAVQFNISESDYRHGDRVDFFIDDMVLTRFIHPVIADFALRRKIVYAADPQVTAVYSLMGRRGLEDAVLRLTVATSSGRSVAEAAAPASREGELEAPIGRLDPGEYQATLTVEGANAIGFDARQVRFRVIEGPFSERSRP